MLHVLVGLYIIGALLGVAAAMFVNHYRLIYGLPFFRPFVRFLMYFSLLMLVLLSTYYASANLEQDGSSQATLRVLWAVCNTALGFVAFSGWLVSFLQVLSGFEGTGLTPASRLLPTVLIAGAGCSYVIGFALAAGGTGSWLRWSRDLYNLAVPALLIVAMAERLRRSGRTEFVVPRRSVRAFLLMYLSAYVIAFALPIVFQRSALLLLALVLTATNVLPFVWVRWSFLPEAGAAPALAARRVPLSAIAERHSLTEREAEILECVLKGSSNAEIAAALSISVGTVKNHVYNVYRKMGVRTRGQLHRYVREAGAAPRTSAPTPASSATVSVDRPRSCPS